MALTCLIVFHAVVAQLIARSEGQLSCDPIPSDLNACTTGHAIKAFDMSIEHKALCPNTLHQTALLKHSAQSSPVVPHSP